MSLPTGRRGLRAAAESGRSGGAGAAFVPLCSRGARVASRRIGHRAVSETRLTEGTRSRASEPACRSAALWR